MSENKVTPLVSVIITTKNEQSCIEDCLMSIKLQRYPEDSIEMIVVDNGSEDKTKQIAKKYTNQVFNKGPERSAQRNLGLAMSQGKYILYLDADMILSKGIIKECVDRCLDEGFCALYIPERIVNAQHHQIQKLSDQIFDHRNQNVFIKARDFERSFYNATCIDAVRFVEKSKASEIGAFDETLNGPEDWDFDRRINQKGKTAIIKSPIYHNEGRFDLKRYISKKNYYAKSFKAYIDKWGCDDFIIKRQIGFKYRFFGVFVERGKWIKLIKHPFLTLFMYILRISVGINYVFKERFKIF